MPLNEITINKGQGGLGRPLEGTDYISGLIVYTDATLPTGFASNDRTKIVYSVEEAEDLGITNAHLGETKSACKIVIAGTPGIGDTLTVTYTGIDGLETVLPTYALVSGEQTSATTAGAAWVREINAGTVNHGFTAVNASGTITLTTKGGEGIFPNTGTPYAVAVTGGSTATLTQPTGSGGTVLGIASDIDIQHYHISEFFRLQPKGKLYVSLQALADVGTFSKITTLQNFAVGEIKQLGIYYKSTAFVTAHCTTIQAILDTLETNHKPISSVILSGEISGTASLAGYTTNLHTLTASGVSVTIGQDGANTGNHIFKATGKSITNLGQVLGSVAKSSVSQSIAWVGGFKVNSTELNTIAFANGEKYNDLSDGVIANLDSYGFLFLRNYVGTSGTYHNRPYTAVALTSDYAFIYLNRTIDKFIANVRATVLPALGSNVKLNTDGTLSGDAINSFKSLAQQGGDVLLRAGELSDYAIIIDPSQDILSTNTLTITAQLLPLGVADFITINVGFTTSLS